VVCESIIKDLPRLDLLSKFSKAGVALNFLKLLQKEWGMRSNGVKSLQVTIYGLVGIALEAFTNTNAILDNYEAEMSKEFDRKVGVCVVVGGNQRFTRGNIRYEK